MQKKFFPASEETGGWPTGKKGWKKANHSETNKYKPGVNFMFFD